MNRKYTNITVREACKKCLYNMRIAKETHNREHFANTAELLYELYPYRGYSEPITLTI